jgi:UDP-N-acetylglucosamine 2-epimerase (non-hydrolysing)
MLLIAYGTRPEYIKIKPLIDELEGKIPFKVLFTGQHLHIAPKDADYHLTIKEDGHRLDSIICSMLNQNHVWEGITHVLIQGDTTSAFAIALAGMNRGVKIIHLEAGLRTFDYENPFPEEYNRQLISRIATLNLCPTDINYNNLVEENCVGEKHIVGNTVLDNLKNLSISYNNQVLVTMHRRENQETLDVWFGELNRIAGNNPELEFIIPLHPNPNVQKHKKLLTNFKVVEPLPYDSMVDVISKCRFIISDSGGIQEEASFLKKKVIVCRKFTERIETINKTSFMCDGPEDLHDLFEKIKKDYVSNYVCPYGDGNAANKIYKIFKKIF